MKKGILKIFICCFVCVLTTGLLFAQVDEHLLKSAYLGKFALFTEWPEDFNNRESDSLFKIGVVGDSKILDALKEFYQNQDIRNKKVLICKILNLNEIDDCHILFISESAEHRLNDILNISASRPVLTISDAPGFCEKGVLLNLFIENNKIRFEINEKAVKESGLYMNFHLLKYAKIISPVKS